MQAPATARGDVDPGFEGVTATEVDAALREALNQDLIEGEAGPSDPRVPWSNPRLTVAGLRHLGQWPSPGQERLLGPWDDGYWGQRALRKLLGAEHDQLLERTTRAWMLRVSASISRLSLATCSVSAVFSSSRRA